MNEGRNSDLPLDRLLDQLDEALESGILDTNVRSSASVALGLCDLAQSQFDDEQKEALSVARRWLSNGNDVDRKHLIHAFTKRLAKGHALPATDRLVFCSINAGSGLDSFKAEFLAVLGSELGLSPEQIASVFSREIPGFTFR